jgi:hypothetical protein
MEDILSVLTDVVDPEVGLLELAGELFDSLSGGYQELSSAETAEEAQAESDASLKEGFDKADQLGLAAWRLPTGGLVVPGTVAVVQTNIDETVTPIKAYNPSFGVVDSDANVGSVRGTVSRGISLAPVLEEASGITYNPYVDKLVFGNDKKNWMYFDHFSFNKKKNRYKKKNRVYNMG